MYPALGPLWYVAIHDDAGHTGVMENVAWAWPVPGETIRAGVVIPDVVVFTQCEV